MERFAEGLPLKFSNRGEEMEATVLALKILMEKLFHMHFLEGGYLLKFLIIDDGWQETVNELHKEVIPNDVVALKIQKPSFPWEFYMYHQLDKCISKKKRSSFGFAHRVHLYSD
ncbi:hypothetical protein L1049_027341 [Liquidambar formosana]|uniref:Uncharacterized protein n=1 Tax=Liquidambar formosana TaxID=63359 RepID=A0AAP0N488_LIQFO